jgi:hypothetical protein
MTDDSNITRFPRPTLRLDGLRRPVEPQADPLDALGLGMGIPHAETRLSRGEAKILLATVRACVKRCQEIEAAIERMLMEK